MACSCFPFRQPPVFVIAFLLCSLLAATTQSFTVTELPHWQSFDSWDDCYYPGACFEQECLSTKAGWVSKPIQIVPFIQQIWTWWTIGTETPSNMFMNGTAYPCNEVLTGPCADHTTGVPGRGKYMYAESSACFGETFQFFSPVVQYSGTGAKLSFWYFMYGADINAPAGNGYLEVDISLNSTTDSWVNIVNITGQVQQSPMSPWTQSVTVVDSFLPNGGATKEQPVSVQYRFTAVTGGNRKQTYWMSDIAIDDVVFSQEGNDNATNPYVDPTPQPSPSPTPHKGDANSDGGLDDATIAAIVAGVVGGFLALLLLLLLLLIALLLLISPRRSSARQAQASAGVGSYNHQLPPNDQNPVAPSSMQTIPL